MHFTIKIFITQYGTNTFLVSNTNTVASKWYFPLLLLQEPMEEFKMESFHPAEPLVASELPSPLVSKPPKEFADETSSTASEAATSASATAAEDEGAKAEDAEK